mmetsp:Transcript_4707/g.14390  ORF Transcript_4707/g.14390 Transcript_4707/m.14390 type:complete len:653 (-) Transcript_4707:210-2168(-)
MAPTAFQLRQASAGSVLSEDTRDDHLHLSDIASVGTEEGDTPDVSTVKQRLSLFQRLRQRWLLGRAAGKMVNPEASRLVPRSGSSKSRRSRRQSTINVPSALLLRALIARLEKHGVDVDGEAAEELSLLLRWHVRHGLQESSLWLVDAFDQLSTGGWEQAADRTSGLVSAPGWDGKREALADRFIDGLCALMRRANYRMMSQKEWQFAQAESFMFVMPIDVAWEALDSSLISRLFVRHPHVGLQAAQLSRRVLVFHRGSGIEQRAEWFLEEKLDMAIDTLFTDPARRCYSALCRAVASRATGMERGSRASAHEADAAEVLRGAGIDTQRINLGRLIPSFCLLLRRFFLRLTVQEPTFHEVAVFYSELGGVGGDEEGREGVQVRLKSFRDIPIADVEVVFPGLRATRIKSADQVKIVMLLLAGIATALYGYYFAHGTDWTVRATLIGFLALRAFQTWRYVVGAKATMEDFIRTTLYHRSQDSQKGVLLHVLNSIEEHEHREALLVYLLMLAQSGPDGSVVGSSAGGDSPPPLPMSAAEAEVLCSAFLEAEFGVAVQLDTHAALARLLDLGLVRRGGGAASTETRPADSVYEAVEVGPATARLREAWRGLQPATAARTGRDDGRGARLLSTLAMFTSRQADAGRDDSPRDGYSL